MNLHEEKQFRDCIQYIESFYDFVPIESQHCDFCPVTNLDYCVDKCLASNEYRRMEYAIKFLKTFLKNNAAKY